MEINIDQTKWWQRIYAALIFFTRLPLWHFYQPPQQCYKTVVENWPLAGWLTGGVMAATVYFGSMLFPFHIALVLAIIARIMLTGALHEDGLADFLDGFGGGGNDRERILKIMKDSHIGTYGVLGLILYFALLYAALYTLTPTVASIVILAGDAYSKMIAAQIIMFLPYARTEETSKMHTVYRKMNIKASIMLFIQGMLPMLPLIYAGINGLNLRWDLLIFVPCIVMYFLYYMMLRKIKGYTGDCCGALFLIIELSFYLTMVVI
ncbi:adenosylcobinamide-GDP ribazoletransferase [Prevotella sp. OH937_COT-195]|uniref:adenosylcobinamide-GDP ribazoletransferase n=1 Tax=Prevotella sp. OH937_COT-195 TaxID=2491051 RepID=UPI000F64BE17|nr:adenosylcobinamide-GDP ribazoletransferase [Prevotella sp. OH937_COT-195]RRC97681.1 adenosylcobinamide-GDP ribazoletransferase [Prevotella sp. OH937_COT-195]